MNFLGHKVILIQAHSGVLGKDQDRSFSQIVYPEDGISLKYVSNSREVCIQKLPRNSSLSFKCRGCYTELNEEHLRDRGQLEPPNYRKLRNLIYVITYYVNGIPELSRAQPNNCRYMKVLIETMLSMRLDQLRENKLKAGD